MTIRDLINQFEIQGAYQIVRYDEETDKTMLLASGYEVAHIGIKEYLDAKITYMYSIDNELIFEIEL